MQPSGTFQQENRNFFFFDHQMHLKRTFDETGKRTSHRAVLYVLFVIWKKHILAPRSMKSQWHQPHLILVGQEMLDFKVWREAQTTELEKCFQNQASNICPIKNALTHLVSH